MPDTKITALTALLGADLAAGDLFPVVDVSDTTMAATGTNNLKPMSTSKSSRTSSRRCERGRLERKSSGR
jgi:hypothetical protein